MNKIQKTKQHIIDNKAVYITGATCLVVGALGGGIYAATRPEVVQKAQILGAINYKPMQNVIQISIDRAGNAGNVWVDKLTGEVFTSNRKLADGLGVTRDMVAQYMRGELPDLAGRQFELVLDGAGEVIVNQVVNPAA